MDRHQRLLALVEDVYAAPGTADGWATFLRHACSALHGSGANLVAHNLVAPDAQILLTVGLDPAAGQAYASHWGRFDPWAYSAATRQLGPGQVVSGEQLVRQSDLEKTGFYNEFGRTYDVTRCLAAMIEHDRRGLSCLTVDRGDTGRPFDEEDAGLVAALLPHLRRAVHLHRQLVVAEGEADARGHALDRVPQAVFIVSAAGAPVHVNARAESILRAADGLVCRAGTLRASADRDNAALHTAIARASLVCTHPERDPGGMVTLSRPSGRRPLVALVTPLPRRVVTLVPGAPSVMVLVSDPERTIAADERMLARVFGLTHAESRLALIVAEGRDLRRAALELGLTIGTVRTRLKSVFSKTGTHRQADLVRVLRSAADIVS